MMLQNSGFVVSEATESERAIEQIRGANFDALLLDLHLADMSALELLRRCPMRPPTVLTTGSVSEVPMDEARALGVVEVVRKPFSAAGLIASMDRALTQPKRGVPANDAAVYLDMPVVTEFRTVAGRAAGEQFVRKAIHDAERVVDQLSHAAASMNSALWLEHVQTLSGIAATMGAKTLKTTAEEALNLKFADIPSRAAAFDERFRDVLAKTIEQLIAPEYLLTERERACIKLVAQGLSYAEVGGRLGVSAKTIEYHIKNAAEKLHVKGRAAVVASALRRGEI